MSGRMSEKGTIPFLLATAGRINKTEKKPKDKSNTDGQSSDERGKPNWKFYGQENPQQADAAEGVGFKFNDEQKEEVKKKLYDVIPVLEAIGEAIGSTIGAVGGKIPAQICGAVGHAVEFIGSLFGWF